MTPETRAEIEAWMEARRGSNRDREALIRKAKSENASLREIADLFGLSHTEIRRVLQRGSQMASPQLVGVPPLQQEEPKP